jgi:hypothetical protein
MGPAGPILSWIEPSGDGSALKYARLDGDRWSSPMTVAEGDDWYVNAADVPGVEALSPELWAAHWRTVAADDAYAYDIAVAVSHDAGVTWSAPRRLNDDGVPAEHGFVSLFAAGSDVGVVWLNGSPEAQDEPGDDSGAEAAEPAADADLADLPPPSGTELRSARLDADGNVLERGVIDPLVCDCCQTDIAASNAGSLLVYRGRTPAEIRDIFVRRQTDAGWSEPIAVGADRWEIAGCPVNGPAIDARGSEAAVAWFTAPDDRPHVRFARSHDAGATFGAALEVDGDGSFGHAGVALADGGDAVVSWWRRAAAGGAELAIRTISSADELGPITTVASTSAARPDDVPQLVRSADRLLLAWTEAGEQTSIKTAAIDAAAEQ